MRGRRGCGKTEWPFGAPGFIVLTIRTLAYVDGAKDCDSAFIQIEGRSSARINGRGGDAASREQRRHAKKSNEGLDSEGHRGPRRTAYCRREANDGARD
jgi:hypothetical protein